MGKIVFVNATAATEGGILTVLKQFINEIIVRNDIDKKYYIFTSIDIEVTLNNIKIINDIKGKKKKDRIIWDLIGMRKWAKFNNIKPDLILSLQNTGVNFKNIPQIVYIHQPLPYAKESKWNIIKRDERIMWFYKYIYKLWIDFTVKGKANIIVQTQWMKDALKDRNYNTENIIVAKPNINPIDVRYIDKLNKNYKYLFYPASDYKYKNHIILILAIKQILEKNKKVDFKIIFTLDKSSNIYSEVRKYRLENYFEFVGNLKYEEIISYYKGCQAVLFPSYIETFGLPLIETACVGKKLLVADCNYSREVIGNYKLVEFIDKSDVEKWSLEIINSMNEYHEQPQKIHIYNEWRYVFDCIDKQIYI